MQHLADDIVEKSVKTLRLHKRILAKQKESVERVSSLIFKKVVVEPEYK